MARFEDTTDYDDDYSQVPWYRRRWAFVTMFLVFMPAAMVIAFSGEIYAWHAEAARARSSKLFLASLIELQLAPSH
jgi:hypothetical protein